MSVSRSNPGKATALILPACKIATTIVPIAHADLLVDQAGWHMSTHLIVPDNLPIILLPSKCPELDGLADLGEALGSALKKPVDALWNMQNGYALCTRAGLDAIAEHLAHTATLPLLQMPRTDLPSPRTCPPRTAA